MNVQSLLNQFVGTHSAESPTSSSQSQFGGFAGGAAAGGVMALLVGNKKARKFAGKAATVGGAAVLGGLAYSALRNWQHNKQYKQTGATSNFGAETARLKTTTLDSHAQFSRSFELTLVKTMISAANADGHIDEAEQSRLFSTMDEMQLDDSMKAVVMDLIRYPESPEILAKEAQNLEQATEIYLMACFTIDVDSPEERTFLNRLAEALTLPQGLPQELEHQASELAQQAA